MTPDTTWSDVIDRGVADQGGLPCSGCGRRLASIDVARLEVLSRDRQDRPTTAVVLCFPCRGKVYGR